MSPNFPSVISDPWATTGAVGLSPPSERRRRAGKAPDGTTGTTNQPLATSTSASQPEELPGAGRGPITRVSFSHDPTNPPNPCPSLGAMPTVVPEDNPPPCRRRPNQTARAPDSRHRLLLPQGFVRSLRSPAQAWGRLSRYRPRVARPAAGWVTRLRAMPAAVGAGTAPPFTLGFLPNGSGRDSSAIARRCL